MDLKQFQEHINAQRLTQVQAIRQANLASIMSVANATLNPYHECNAEDME